MSIRCNKWVFEAVSIGESSALTFKIVDPARKVRYLKIDSGHSRDDLLLEVDKFRWVNGFFPVANVLHSGSNSYMSWMVTEEVPGASVKYRLSHASVDERDRIITTYASALSSLHQSNHDMPLTYRADPFELLRMARCRIDNRVFNLERFASANGGRDPDRLWHILMETIPSCSNQTLVHGDYSTNNVIIDEDGSVALIDVGRSGLGDPHIDVAVACACLREFGHDAPQKFIRAYGERSWKADTLAWFEEMARLFWCG